MSMMFREVRARGAEVLTEDALRRHVPALFADRPHDSRSDRYAYIPSIAVMRGLASEGFHPVAVRQSRTRDDTRRGFTKHMVRFRRDDAFLRRVGDTVPEIVLVNSHDGTSSYNLMAGLFRLICLNGMVIPAGSIAATRVSHHGDSQRVIGKVIEGAHTVLAESVKALEAPRNWSRITMHPRERAAFAEAAHTLRFADAEGVVDTPIQPAQLLVPRRHDDTGQDLWRTFNVVQENVMRGGLSAMRREPGSRPRRVTTRAVNGIDQDVKLNKALWTLSERGLASKKKGPLLRRPTFDSVFASLRRKGVGELQAGLAEIAGAALDFQSFRGERPALTDKGVASLCNALQAKALNKAIRAGFDAKDYFAAISRSMIVRAVAEAMGEDHARQVAKMNKGAAAKFATANLPKTGWLPVQLRTAHYDGPGRKSAKAARSKKKTAKRVSK